MTVVNKLLKIKRTNKKCHSLILEVNHTRRLRQKEADQIVRNRTQVCMSKLSETLQSFHELMVFLKLNYSDEVSCPTSNQEDTMNSSNPLARPHTGTSLDDSSPATSDDESLGDMETWSSVTAEQLTEVEKKRQEIIKGMKTLAS